MMKKTVTLTATLIISSIYASATIINIPADYPTIQQGIDASVDGDTVLVQPGTYVENINFNGHNIVLGSLFLTTGDTSYIEQTVIDGDSAGTVVVITNNEDSTSVLTGFTITNGLGNAGGIQIADSAPRISHNLIKNNTGTIGGGGIESIDAGPVIIDNLIKDNYAEIKGAGIYCYGPSARAKIFNNLILYNHSQMLGGGVTCFVANPLIINNTIYGNEADSFGGAIYCSNTSAPRITNCIIRNNSAMIGNEIYLHFSSPSTEINYCDVEGGWPGMGNIDADPLFRDPPGGDFHLMSQACGDQYDSPCIDIGNPSFTDRILDCQNGLGTELSDLGAYGGGILIPRIFHVPFEYSTIQKGIDASFVDGDTVLVLPGTYHEGVTFNGHNVILGSLYLTTGDTSFITQTEIDWGAWFADGEDSTARITGFSLHGLYGVGSPIFCDSSSPTIDHNIISDAYVIGSGAGIRCENYSSPIIVNNLIIDNGTYGSDTDGGGIYIGGYCSPLIKENAIKNNGAVENGGGIYCEGFSNPIIVNNKIYGNSSGFSGGGIFCILAGAVISGNEITGNRTGYPGGGLACVHSLPTIISNNIITGNRASSNSENGRGGAIYGWEANLTIINNIFFGNIADSIGGAVHCVRSSPIMMNNIFWADSIGYPAPISANELDFHNSSPVIEYCDIQGGWPGTGNVDIDPLFHNPAGGDFHLMSMICGDTLNSPCIDAGSPYYSDSLLDCSWGLGTTASDMGAYGGGDTAFVGIWNSSSSLPERFLLLQNFPNPFNAQTTIRFWISESRYVKLIIYNLLGSKVETLVDEEKYAGQHQAIWDALDYSSGVYFYRIETRDFTKTRKMILLK